MLPTLDKYIIRKPELNVDETKRAMPREERNKMLQRLSHDRLAKGMRPGEYDANEAEARKTLAPLMRACAATLDDINVSGLFERWAAAIDGDLLAHWEDDGTEMGRKIVALLDGTGEGRWTQVEFDYMFYAQVFAANQTTSFIASLDASRYVSWRYSQHGDMRTICVTCYTKPMLARIAPPTLKPVVSDDTKSDAQPEPAKASKVFGRKV